MEKEKVKEKVTVTIFTNDPSMPIEKKMVKKMVTVTFSVGTFSVGVH